MITHRNKLRKAEEKEYGARLKHLRELGVAIGHALPPAPKATGLILKPINRDCARLYPLPSDAVTVVVPVTMIVPKSGLLVVDYAMLLPGGDELQLDGIEESPSFDEVIRGYPSVEPEILNQRLKTDFPLRPCLAEGLIVASGWTRFPANYHDGWRVPVELRLWDACGNEFSFAFDTAMDFSVSRVCERRRQTDRESERPSHPTPDLFEPLPEYLVGCNDSVSRAQAIHEHFRQKERAVLEAGKSEAMKPGSATKPGSPGATGDSKRRRYTFRSDGRPEASSNRGRDIP